MNIRKFLRLALGVFLAVAFLWLIARRIRPEDIKHAFQGTDPLWIAAALAAFAIGYSCRIARWRLMLKRDNPVLTWRDCAGPLLASFAANNVLPFRAGDVLRSFAFNRKLGVTSGIVIATLFAERLLDLLMVLVLLGAALAVFGMDSASFAGVGSTVLIAAGVVILGVLLFPRSFAPLARAAGNLACRISPRIGEKLLAEIDKSLSTLDHLAQGGTMFKLVCWSLLAWLSEGCVFWFAARALPSISASSAGWLALPVGTLATLIPSTPGYVGTFDYFTVRAMTALGNTTAAAAAHAILVHALLWLPPTLAGGLYLLLRPAQRASKAVIS